MEAKAFWNARAGLGEQAGTQDTILHRLEVEEIAKHVKDGMRVLDVGCGNGMTAIELAERFDIGILGIDFAEDMVKVANRSAFVRPMRGAARFLQGDIISGPFKSQFAIWVNATSGESIGLEAYYPPYDLIYTKRCIINLPDWPTQAQAIRNILGLLKPNGQYLMVESSQDGLDRLNELRAMVGLPAIKAPWHNRYLRDEEITDLAIPVARDSDCFLADEVDFTSTYYVLSRCVNAYLAAQEGKEPAYDAPVNQLALKLPSIGNCGQTRVWLWRKAR